MGDRARSCEGHRRAERQRGVGLVHERRRSWLRALRHVHGDSITETGTNERTIIQRRDPYLQTRPDASSWVSSPWPGRRRRVPATMTRSPRRRAAERERGGRGAGRRAVQFEGSAGARRLAARVGRGDRAGDRRAAPRGGLSRARHAWPLRRAALARHAGAAVALHAPDGRRDLGLRLGRRQLSTDSQRQPEHLAEVHRADRSGALSFAGHADVHERDLVRAGPGGDRRQHRTSTTFSRPPAWSPPTTSGSAPVRSSSGTSRSAGSRPSTSTRWGWGSISTPTSVRAPSIRVSSEAPTDTTRCRPSTARTSCSTGPTPPRSGTSRCTSTRSDPCGIELLGQFGNDGTGQHLGGRPAAIFDLGWFKLRGALEYQYEFAEDPAADAQEHHQEPRRRGLRPGRVGAVHRVRA